MLRGKEESLESSASANRLATLSGEWIAGGTGWVLEDQGKMPEEAENKAEDGVYVGETSCNMGTRMEVYLTDYVGAMSKSKECKGT